MQVDLFKSRRRTTDMRKFGGYVRIRDFQLDPNTDFDVIRKLTNCSHKDVVDEYIEDVKRRIAHGRQYEDIGYDLCADNLFDVEALGVGLYAKKYQIIISFEDCLDFFLHIVSDCDMEKIRSIPNYHEISANIMSLRPATPTSSARFNDLFDVDPKLDEYFISRQKYVKETFNTYGDHFIDQLAFEIIRPLLMEVHGVQDYLISCFSAARSELGDAVCRSRNYSSLVITTDDPMLCDLTLNYEPFGSLTLAPKCYEKYEYATKEVLVCDNCRRC